MTYSENGMCYLLICLQGKDFLSNVSGIVLIMQYLSSILKNVKVRFSDEESKSLES